MAPSILLSIRTGQTPGVAPVAGTAGGGFWRGAVQADGKIVGAGIGPTIRGSYQMLVARLNADGSPDLTFGTNGVVLDSLIGGAFARSVAIQADGKIVTAGSATGGIDGDFAVVRSSCGDPPPAALLAPAAVASPTNISPVPSPIVAPLVLDDPGLLDGLLSGRRSPEDARRISPGPAS